LRTFDNFPADCRIEKESPLKIPSELAIEHASSLASTTAKSRSARPHPRLQLVAVLLLILAPCLSLTAQVNDTFDVDGAGNVTANSFSGDGSGLTNVNAETANTANTADSAFTASRLSSNPSNCPGGRAAAGINQFGDVEGCFDVVTGPELNNKLACQPGMSPFGDWCIDNILNTDQVDAEDAISTCISEGKMLCPLEAIHACDVVNFMSGGDNATCGNITDEAGGTIITSTFCGDTRNGTSLNDLVIYDGTDNSARCEDGELAQFFCCSTRLDR
jgi:hypothetical protein